MAASKVQCVRCGDGSVVARTAFDELCLECQEGRCMTCAGELDSEYDDCCACLEAAEEAARETWHEHQRAERLGAL